MASVTFTELILYFALYSFLGWVCEVGYSSIPAKKFINKGFLAGPLCPVYGFGALIILYLPRAFAEKPIILFLSAVIAATLLEYATSWAMEMLFGIRWWDYSKKKVNINGRVCLQNSLIFGALGVMLSHLVHPFASQLMMGIGGEYKRVTASLLFAAIAIDFVATLNTLYKLDERLKKLKAILVTADNRHAGNSWLDGRDLRGSFLRLEEICAETRDPLLLESLEKIRGLTAQRNPGRRLLAAFPNMKHRAFEERLPALTEILKNARKSVHESTWRITGRWIQKTARKAGEGVRSFAYGLNFYKLFWIFYISSVIGYVLEILYCFVTLGYIESRQGLIYGSFSPIYGFGAVIMVVFLKRLEKRRDIWVFAGSALIGGAFEFLCSFLQEKVFGTVSWDYSRETYSIGGRTSLLYMFFWGILGVVLIKAIYPAMSRFVERIPNRSGPVITWILVFFMCFNMLVSAMAVARWSQRTDGIAPQNVFAESLDRHYPDIFLEEVYPNMKKVKVSE